MIESSHTLIIILDIARIVIVLAILTILLAIHKLCQ